MHYLFLFSKDNWERYEGLKAFKKNDLLQKTTKNIKQQEKYDNTTRMFSRQNITTYSYL